ncbi:hypothetical protein F3Y22_tig00111131pilonHSYRG00219 [Hibiscus syriacus]|uniref:Uncharacterized protein n=1 Tax=Hibiscus syriacus TaxID=106335 RepID=A0A6A2YYF0_HIBSY|nr:uncharacterized protein LOC120154522 [Hibiscus syriacus]KAE8684423.1 hypothetical protein F3Y22_tig00111131pilonHSYRG00219 [Hibiscus syriacus]
MASSNETQKYSHLITSLVFFSSISLSSARLLNGHPSATRPTSNLALHVAFDGSDKPELDPKSTALPFEHMVLRSPTQKLAGKYGPMFLGMLPKGGNVPSSGPSKRSNDIKT